MHFNGLGLLNARMRCNIVRNPDIATNDRMMTNGDSPKDASVGIDSDIIFDDGMARHIEHIALGIILETLGA